MGKSVLTPEESLLGKVTHQGYPRGIHGRMYDGGGKGIRRKFRNPFVGRDKEATKQLTTVGGMQGSLA